MGSYKPLFVWWVLTILLAALSTYLAMSGVFTIIYQNDLTHITQLIAALVVVGNFRLGWLAWCWAKARLTIPRYRKHVNEWREATGEYMALGILGTVVGFSYLFYETFQPLMNATQAELSTVVPTLLPKIIGPIGTIFFCTGAGLAAAIYTRAQLMLFRSLTGIEDDQYEDQT